MLQDVPLTFIVPIQQQITASSNSFKTNSDQLLDVPLQCPQNSATGFGGGVDATYMISGPSHLLQCFFCYVFLHYDYLLML